MNELFFANRQRLAHFQSRLRALVTVLSDAQLRAKPQPHEWSAIENVGHLIDTEQLLRYRITRMCTEAMPTLINYDQDAAVVRHGYQQADLFALLATLAHERQVTLAYFARLPLTHLARTGWHSEYGLWQVASTITYLTNHDELHYNQILGLDIYRG
ncbi:MAG: DinB family protein [Roseiflexaceae bacterium]